MKKKNVKMTRGMAFLFAIVMLVTQLGIGNLNVYASDDTDDGLDGNHIISEIISDFEPTPVVADDNTTQVLFNGQLLDNDSYVFESNIYKGNPVDNNIEDDYAYYKDGVLTLHNFQLVDCTLSKMFEINGSLQVVLEGENIISYKKDNESTFYPTFVLNNSDKKLTITGSGSLKIKNSLMGIMTAANYDSDYEGESLVIDGVKLDFECLLSGIIAYNDVSILNSDVSINYTEDNYAGGAPGAINVFEGELSIINSKFSADGYVDKNKTNLTSADITHASGIYAGSLNIYNSDIDINNIENGISVYDGDFKSLSADVNISAYDYGIKATDKITMSESNVMIINAYGEDEYQKASVAVGFLGNGNNYSEINIDGDTSFTEKGFFYGIENYGAFLMSSGEVNLLHSNDGIFSYEADKLHITGGQLNISTYEDGIRIYGDIETDTVVASAIVNITSEGENNDSGIDIWNYKNTSTHEGLIINGDAKIKIDGFKKGISVYGVSGEDYSGVCINGGILDIDVEEYAIYCEEGFRMISGDVTLQSKIAAIRKSYITTVIELGDSVSMAAGSTFDSMVVINPDKYANEKCVHLYKNCVVTFDNNGHGKVLEPMNVVYGAYVSLPKLDSDGIYDFGGWYKEKECINPWNENLDTVKDDITLYAKWDIRYHDIKIDNIENGTVTVDKSKAYMGEKVAINVVSANGFELDTLAVMDVSGKKNIELKNNVFEMPDEDVVIKATFKELSGDEDPGTDILKDIDESFGKYILIKQKMNVSDMFAATKEIYKDEPKVKFKYVIAGTDKAETKNMKKAASVTGKGLLKAKKAGFVNVTLQKRAKGEKKWTTVSSNSIRIVAPSFNTNDGKGKKFIATYIGQLADANLLLSLTDSKMTISGNACVNSLNENAEKITWSSKSKAVTVDEKGKITVNKTGSAVVKAVIEKEGYGKSTVSLKISVKIPKFAKAEYKVKAGKSVKLAIKNTVKGVNDVVSMTSDNPAITVDVATKKVTVLDTAKSGDKAVITAVTTDGKSYSCNVVVK